MKSFFKKNILFAVFLDVFAFLSLYLMFSAAQSLNYNPQTHINIKNPIYDFFTDFFLLFISQITLIQVINSKLLKDKKEIKITHLVFLVLVIISILISSISPLIHRAECEKIIWSPMYKNISGAGQCFTFMENVGKGLFAIYFIGIPAIFLFTSISLLLNLFLMSFSAIKENNYYLKLLWRVIIILLILAYPFYVILRIPFFLNNT